MFRLNSKANRPTSRHISNPHFSCNKADKSFRWPDARVPVSPRRDFYFSRGIKAIGRWSYDSRTPQSGDRVMSNRIIQKPSDTLETIGQDGLDRRRLLKCMAWAGAGVLWTVSGGVPRSIGIGDADAATTGFTFAQISDTHIGFNKDANPHPETTTAEAVARIRGAQPSPSFVLHTGDITHLSKPDQFDAAQQIIKGIGSDVHYV